MQVTAYRVAVIAGSTVYIQWNLGITVTLGTKINGRNIGVAILVK